MVGDIAHICNRGVEKRKIFLDRRDYSRFVENLYFLNNQKGKLITEKKNIFQTPYLLPKQDKLVEILKWVALPNHYHLLLHEIADGGILEFTKRLGNAYTKYFNTKNEGRSGYLFQNSAKIIKVENNRHFLYLPFYIDLNPVELSTVRSIEFLRSYAWSSFRDYFGDGKYVDIIDKDLFYELFDTKPDRYFSEVADFLKHR